MLIIKRRPDEAVVIDGRIFVRLVMVLDQSVVVEIESVDKTSVEWRVGAERHTIPVEPGAPCCTLVLESKRTVRVNRDVQISLQRIASDKASLGFIAPPSISLKRAEALETA